MPPRSFHDRLIERLPELMRAAVAEANRADLPFGCVLADATTGELKGAAGNSSRNDPTAHAEVNALRLMARSGLDPGAIVLVSTAEPCPMCASASWWAGVAGVVFGTSIATLLRLGWNQLDLPMPTLLSCARPPSRLIVQGDFLSAETDLLYRSPPGASSKRGGTGLG